MTNQHTTKRPKLSPKRAEQFIENAQKLKIECLIKVKSLLSELNGHNFDPHDDCRSKYSKAAKFASELEAFLVGHCEKHPTKVEEVLVAKHGSVNYGMSSAHSVAEATKDCDGSPPMMSGVTSVGYPVNYAGDRGSYTQCSAVEMYGGRRESLCTYR